MTGDLKYYMLREDNDTFRLTLVDATRKEEIVDWKPVWKALPLSDIKHGVVDESATVAGRRFLLAAAALMSGEAHQRRTLQRITASGTRNIRVNLLTVAEYVEETFYPGEGVDRRKLRRRNKYMDDDFARITELFSQLVPPIKRELRFPDPEQNPSEVTYTISEDLVTAVANDACREYLRRIGTGRLLTTSQLVQVQSRLEKICPDDADDIIDAIAKTKSREHLAAISFSTSKDGHRLVSIVNVRGDMVTMEDWKFLQLIRQHGESLSLGQLDRRGGWLPEPVLKFNNNRVGEILGRYTADDSTLHVLCRNEVPTSGGRTKLAPMDRSEFVIDQDYLVCLYIALSQLREQADRYDQLREQAEVKVALGVDGLLDDDYFDRIDQEET